MRNKGKRRLTAAVLKQAWLDERGQDLIEYVVVVALIAVGAIASMQSAATSVGTAFSSLGSKLTTYTT